MTKSGLPAVLHQTLRAYAVRQRRILVLRGIGETMMVQVAGLACVAAIDASVHPSHGAHWALSLAAYAAAGAVLAVRVVKPMVARPALVDHAHDIECRSDGRLEERLSSAVELAGRPAGGVSAWMIERTIALAAQEAAGLDVVELYSARPARVAWLRAGMVAVALAGCCLVPGVPMFLVRAAWPAVLRPSRIHLEVLPGDLRLASGSPLDLQIKASPDPGSASLAVVWDDGVSEHMPLERTGESGAYTLHLSAVTRGLHYRVLAGDGESRGYRVEVAQPPLLEKISLRITPPLYTGLPVRTVDGGDAEFIAGSMVALQAQIGGAQSVTGSLTYDGGEHAAVIEGGLLRAELKPAATLSYGVRLVGTSGLVAEPPQRWLLTVLPDKPPLVKLSGRGLEAGLVGRDEALMVDVEASDDIGLRAVEVVIEVDGKERRRLPLKLPAAGRREAKIELGIDLSALSLAIGESVSLSARATDVGGQVAASKPLALAVSDSADARGSALASRLRAVLKHVDAQNDALRAMARQWSGLTRADHGDDLATLTGELKLVSNRLDLWSSELGSASQQLHSEGLGGGMALSSLVVSLAEELAAWTRGVAHQLGSAASDGQEAHGAAALLRGRGLCEAALADLASFRHDLALVVARLEASTLAGGAESALARLQRALPVARGERGWRGEGKPSEPGLLGVFYAGTELSGTERFREVAVPNWRNRDVPKLGRDNFSVRYSGEVLIPSDGEWYFMAGADDGVRLSVNGKDLLPKEAWKTQGYTDFHGHLHLQAGWHPIVLEMFQGTGDSGIGLAMGANDHEIHPLTLASLRSASGQDSGDMVRMMADLPREQVGAADLRMASALGMIALVPESIGQIGVVAANDELNRLARQHHEPAAALALLAGKLAAADSQALLLAERSGSDLAADARRARDLLEEQVGRELHGRVQAGDLSPLRQALARVRDRAQDLHRVSDRLSSKDRELRLRIEFEAGRAWISELGREALAIRRALLDEARRNEALLPTRAAAVQGARHLAAFTPAVRDALVALAAQPDNVHQAGDRLNEQAGRLEGLLHECEDWERKLHREQLVELAHATAAELPEHTTSIDENRYQRLAALVSPVIRAVRRGGESGQADALEKMLGSGSADVHAAELTDRLAQLGRDGQSWYGDLDRQTAEQLKSSAGELAHRAKEAGQVALTVVDLDEARLSLAIDGEHRRDDPPAGLAAAFMVLSTDIGVVVDGKPAPSPEQVEEFAKRAAALANMRGDQERAAAIAAAAQHKDAATASASLQALAEQARHAADHPEERAAVVDALKTLAQADAARERAADAAKRLAAAEQLRDLVARDAALKAEELAARQAFADTERKLAEAMPELAAEAKTVSAEVKDPELAKALTQADQELPQAAREARDLGAQAERRPMDLRDVAAPASAQPQAQQGNQAQANAQDQQAQAPQAQPASQPQADAQAQNAQANPASQPQANAQAQNAQAQQANQPQANAQAQQAAQQGSKAQPAQAQNTPPQGAQAQPGDQAPAPQDGLPSAELVQRAEALADQIAAKAATPVAEHYQHHATAKAGNDDPTRKPEAAVGRDLANLVAEERAAAERLAQVVGAEDQERQQLSQAIEAAAALAETPPSDLAGQQTAPAAAQQSAQAQQAQQAAQQAQRTASDLQQQADRAQAAAQAAQAAADAAQAGDDQARAQQSEAQAAAAEQQAVAAEGKALDAQINALALEKAAASQSGDPRAEAAAAEAAANLSAAEQDSLQGLQNAEHDGQAATAQQASRNLARAAEALQSLAGSEPRDAQSLAQALSAEAAAESAAPAGVPAAPSPGSDAAANAEVAGEALGEIQAAPGQGSGFQQASQTLAAAARQSRLAHQLGQGQGQGKGQGQGQGQGQGKGPSGQPGGENQGIAATTGTTGSAAGMTTAPPGVDQAEWAKSRAEVKQNVRSGGIEQFSEEHQEAIRAYLKRLGEDQ